MDNVFNPNFLNEPQQVQQNKNDIEWLLDNQFVVYNTQLVLEDDATTIDLTDTDIPVNFNGENGVLLTAQAQVFKIVVIEDNIVYINYYATLPKGETGATGATGPQGAPGVNGVNGADGVGVPTGGTTGQVLAKTSDADFDTEWVNQSGGGGDSFDPSLLTEIQTYSQSLSSSDYANVCMSLITAVYDGASHTRIPLLKNQFEGETTYFRYNGTEYPIHFNFTFGFGIDDGVFSTDRITYKGKEIFKLNLKPVVMGGFISYWKSITHTPTAVVYDASTGATLTQNQVIQASQPYNIPLTTTLPIFGTSGVNVDANDGGTGINVSLDAEITSKLARTLVSPVDAPASTELVAIGANNGQENISIGDGLTLENNTLSATSSRNIYQYVLSFNIINAASANAKLTLTMFSNTLFNPADYDAKLMLLNLYAGNRIPVESYTSPPCFNASGIVGSSTASYGVITKATISNNNNLSITGYELNGTLVDSHFDLTSEDTSITDYQCNVYVL